MKLVAFSKVTCLVLLAILFATTDLTAQISTGGLTGRTKTITTALPFLLIAPDSRHGGIGEAGVALTDDANAMHWNPSALAFIEGRSGFSLSYSPWLRSLNIPDINLAYLSGYFNLGEKGGTIGTSLRYFSLGEIQFTDIEGYDAGRAKPNEFALDVGYARKITSAFSASVALRYAYSNLTSNAGVNFESKPAQTFAGDLSFLYNTDFVLKDLPSNFRFGVNISNIGTKVSYTSTTGDKDFIPTNLRVGYALKVAVDEYNSLTFTNDFNKLLVPSDGGTSDQTLIDGLFSSFSDRSFGEEMAEIQTSVGLEYWYREMFSARLGYFYEDPTKGNRKFITLGAGVKYNVFGLHFAYLAPLEQNHPLQNTLRFTLTYDFESTGNE